MDQRKNNSHSSNFLQTRFLLRHAMATKNKMLLSHLKPFKKKKKIATKYFEKITDKNKRKLHCEVFNW